jgi:three-Cys-motif partner protein
MSVNKMKKLPFETWDYEEQTKMKHLVFSDYFDKWVKIVGSYNKLNYIDGFAGIGAYKDSKDEIHYGSPILAAKVIEQNSKRLNRKVNILIIDNDDKNLDNIDKIFKYEEISIDPEYVNDDFDDTINGLLDDIPNLAPTLVFIDPFGFDIKMETLERIMKINKSEIILNFMFYSVNRSISIPNNANACNKLFGGNEWERCSHLQNINRERCIIETYRAKLKEFSKYVCQYRFMFPTQRRTYYYLFHLTNHHKGCSIMKSSFAKFNLGRTEYRGNRNNQIGFFDRNNIKINHTKNYLKRIYKGQKRTYLMIIEEQIDETEFLEKHLYKAIKEMEESNELIIERDPPTTPKGRIRKSIKEQDIIIFSE